MRKRGSTWACGIVALLATTAANAQEFYFAGDERVPLIASDTHAAIVTRSEQGQVAPGVLAAIDERRDVMTAASFPALDDARVLVLLRRVDTVPVERFAAAVAELLTLPGVESEAPLYEIAGVQHALLNEFVIQFTADATQERIDALLRTIGAEVLLRFVSTEGLYRVRIRDTGPREALDVINRARNDPIVQFAEPSFLRYRPPEAQPPPEGGLLGDNQSCSVPQLSVATPNDEYLDDQWALDRINAFDAWNITKGSASAVIAMLDSGVSTAHDDLMSKIWLPFDATGPNACEIAPDNDQDPNYWDQHGTEMAGIAAASTDNGSGIAGVSWHSKVMPVRIIESDMNGGQIWSEYKLYCGIKTAVARGATVLNASWHFGGPTALVNAQIDNALAQNRVFVAAAGYYVGATSTLAQKQVRYPANLSAQKAIIAVGGSSFADTRKEPATGSNWGSPIGSTLSLVAPAQCVRTTGIDEQTTHENDYTWSYGTSAATALVSGAAGLLQAMYPTASPLAIRDWLQRGAAPIGPTPVPNDEVGHGRLDLASAFVIAATPFLSLNTTNSDCVGGGLRQRAVIEAVLRQGGQYGPPIPNATITFTLSSDTRRSLTAQTDENGEATLVRRLRRADAVSAPVVRASAAGATARAPLCGER